MKSFTIPDFSKGKLELRFENNEVCIYGTSEGLKRLASLCLYLVEEQAAEHSKNAHIHLEDHELLTVTSLPGVVGVFP